MHFSTPTLQLLSGWSYLFGAYPCAEGKRVRAVANGTRMVLEIDQSVDRVYLLPQFASRYVDFNMLMPQLATQYLDLSLPIPGPHSIDLYVQSATGEWEYRTRLHDEGHFVEISDDGSISAVRDVRDHPDQLEFIGKVQQAVGDANLSWPWLWP